MTAKLRYDERPDPRRPGQQGVLFRNVAPAMDQSKRQHQVHGDFGKDYPDTLDERVLKGRATGSVPPVLYHGTAARMRPGNLIQPGKPANFEGYATNTGHGMTQDIHHTHVFATRNLHDAYRFAMVAQEHHPGSQAAVYEVQPTGPVQTDPEDVDARTGYGGAESFQSKHPLRVLNKIQFSQARDAYKDYMENELGALPGDYEFAPKPRNDWY